MNVGTTLRIWDVPMRVARHIGTGGEGEVFEVVSDEGSDRYALKWYHARTTYPARRRTIEALVERGAPSSKFLWPLGVIVDPETDRFGYVMHLRPESFTGLPALLRGDAERDEGVVVRFAFELALAFRELHLRGLCYRDINFGNAFMEPSTGAVLVCDNDNVGIEGVDTAQVLGSRRFMAPEIVRREALPSKHTDRYSLAVMLFYLLVVHHPLDGARTEAGLSDAQADMRHYGSAPLFCFDPTDVSNRPVPDLHPHVEAMWQALPATVQDLFTRSFTSGLFEPSRRVVDSEWCHVLADMRSHRYECSTCGQGCFHSGTGAPAPCTRCASVPTDLLVLETSRGTVVAFEGATLSAHHAKGNFDQATVYGTVERHPTRPGVLGIRNDAATPMTYRDPAGNLKTIDPGKRALIAPGAHFVWNELTATVSGTSDRQPGH